MRTRSSGLALLASLTLILGACAAAGTPTPAASTPAAATTPPAATEPPSEPASEPPTEPASEPPSEPASEPPTEPASEPASEPPTGEWTIGVVTDVGTVDDKNFNEYSYLGATNGATAIGAGEVDVAVPEDASQYASLIQDFVDTGHNIIVTVGFNLANDTAIAALASPDVWFIGVDQAPCIDEAGAPDPTFTCAGDLATLLPNFVGLQYAEDQAGYLAGIVAASISDNGNVGAIGGINLVPAVVRYIQGYELGAQSVNPDINVVSDYVSTSDFGVAFNDPAAGKTFAEQFIDTNDVDVLFQVAGKTGNGVLEAACQADIHGIGVDVDQWLSLAADTTPAYACIVTSAEKKLASSVEQTIVAISDGSVAAGIANFNASNEGIGLSPENSGAGLITPEIQALIDTALQGMQDGSLVTCPENCGVAE
jgi:basic membrane protein A and related proteins